MKHRRFFRDPFPGRLRDHPLPTGERGEKHAPTRTFAGAVLLLLAALTSGCSRGEVTRDEWQAMQPRDKGLYVASLIGHEKATERKGGKPVTGATSSTEEYVELINERYKNGSEAPAEVLFKEIRSGE